MSKRTKIFVTITIALLIYGNLCRWFDLYFFWDSKSLVWDFLIITGISWIYDNMKNREQQKLQTTWNKVGIGILGFRLALGIFVSVYIRLFSETYSIATNYVRNDKSLQQELGTITGFGLHASGNWATEQNAKGKFESATFYFIVKGENKFRDITVHLSKDSEHPDWEVSIF
jgi:hypothetical protein